MVDKLLEFGKKLLERFKEWWNKFQPKQKTIIIGIGVAILLAVGILVFVLTRKVYVPIATAENTQEGALIKSLLDENGYDYNMSSDGLNFEVLKKQEGDANLLLGSNFIATNAYTIDDVLEGSFSTTEADKQKRYIVLLQTNLQNDIARMPAVKSATVTIDIPEDNGTLIAQNRESYASIMLELNEGAGFTQENAEAIARFAATGLGNDTTDNITITDFDGRIWFPVEEVAAQFDKAETMMMYKQDAESLIKNEVQNVLLGTGEFNQIKVAANVIMDFSTRATTTHEFYAPEGADQGLYSHTEEYRSNATDGVGGIPGTDSNSETDVLIDESTGTNTSTYEAKRDFVPNERITNEEAQVGTIVYDDSTVSVAAIRYRVIREEDVRLQGYLDGITWEEYKLANDVKTRLEVDDDLVGLVANAIGVPTSNVSIVANEEVQFVDAVEETVEFKDIIQIILIIIILALLAFVVFMSLRTKREVEEEEELSVEELLETSKEELESIETEQKSEARKLIENFVEENPEAVATLLRNWLDEDWG